MIPGSFRAWCSFAAVLLVVGAAGVRFAAPTPAPVLDAFDAVATHLMRVAR